MLEESFDFMRSLDMVGVFTVFWFFWLFEMPRYCLSTFAVGFQAAFGPKYPKADPDVPVSVLLIGFNEADGLRRSVMSLREQTHRNLQLIVVDDGSIDGMGEAAVELLRHGLVENVFRCGTRGGKVSGLNLALHYCKHDIILILDIDTSFDRDAVSQIVSPLVADPSIGAVSGNLQVRNVDDSLLTRLQSIEYYSNITVGRQFTSMMNWLMIVSGAFGAFRRQAVDQVGRWDVGPGDDSNITVKIRRAGWKVVFVPEAWALTNVPATHAALWRQRSRWSRSLIRHRLRKWKVVFNPLPDNFSFDDMFAILNLLWFNVFLTFSFVIYLIWAAVNYGRFAIIIMLCLYMMNFAFKCIEFAVAWMFHGRPGMLRLLPYLPVQTFYVGYYMRLNRFLAYWSELIFRRSYRDDYYPLKVHNAQDQF